MDLLIKKIVEKTWLKEIVVTNIIKLLDEWNTIPFIARYRKELTQWATDEQLRNFNDIYEYTKNLEKRKEDIIRLIDEKGLLTDELRKQINEADTLARLEDLYRPFKEKKNTKAMIAKEKWLEPLAEILKKANLTKQQFEEEAKKFVKDTGEAKTTVKNVEEAIGWTMDIVAEEISDNADIRKSIYENESVKWIITTKPTKNFEENWVYKIYKTYSNNIQKVPSYAYLAISRAEDEKQISVKIEMDEERIFEKVCRVYIPANANSSKEYIIQAIEDSLKRLILPSIERQIRSDKKEWADIEAIKVFGENLKNLLLTPPLKDLTVLGFDPAYRTGCKLAVVDKTGKFLYNTVIYPTPPQNDLHWATTELLKIISTYKIDLIVIWNWTASRESENFVANFIKQHKLSTKYMVVSESWASVYSASKLAQEEYPKLDVTVRWAISIASRVIDPLAEFTKIDPKALWVWQYQHDVDQKLLQQKLDEKVEDVVNRVWVNLNTANYTLLSYIAGLSLTMAKNIIEFRNEKWWFKSKDLLKKVKWVWPKAFEQAVWFLRIKWWENTLDQTWIHPESYKITYEILEKELWISKKQLKLPLDLWEKINPVIIRNLAEKYGIWLETLNDIFQELKRPWLDPRDEIEPPVFKSDVMEITDLKDWIVLDWVVRNVTDFGAFVDIWLHNDWLVHISQLSNQFVRNPIEIVSVWQKVKVKVIWIDLEREKVQLSMKDL